MSRQLSPIERILWLVDQVTRQNFVMIAHVKGCIDEVILRQALNLLQMKFLPLRWKIKNDNIPEFSTEKVPPIPLRVINRKNDEQWIDEANKEMNEIFPFSEGPLIRVVLIKNIEKNELLVTFCHIAADATSGVMIIKNLLELIGKLMIGERISNEISSIIPPPSNEAIKKNLKFPSRLLEFLNYFYYKFYKPVELTGEVLVSPEERITKVIHRTFSIEETQRLVKKCKLEKTSVHSALCAALLQTVVQQIRETHNVPQKKALLIGCLTPINLRNAFTTSREEDIGYYISLATHYQRIDENSSLWKTARKIKKEIQKEIKYGRDIKAVFEIEDFLKMYSNPIELMKAIHTLNPPVVATNLGVIDIAQNYGNLLLEKLHFTVALQFDAKNGISIAVTTFQGKMTVNILYSVPYISEKKALIISENMFIRLKNSLNQ